MKPISSHRSFVFYLVLLSAATLAFLSLVIGLNWYVDPQDRLGSNTHGVYVDQDRPSKARLARKWPHDALLLGSSKVGFVDPLSLPGFHFFNGAFVAAAPEEILSFLRYYGADAKFVAIGFDLFMFNLSHEPLIVEDRFAPESDTALSRFEYLFSIDTATESLENLAMLLKGEPPVLRPDGQRDPWPMDLAEAPFSTPSYERALNELRDHHFGNFQYAAARIEYLKQIKALLESRHQSYMIFINPLNRQVLQMLERIPAGAALARFRRDVAAVFPDVKDASSGPWSDDRFFYRHDPFHYRPETGTAFLSQFIKEWMAANNVQGSR